MPAGLQIFDEIGNAILDVNDTTAKYLGSINTGPMPDVPAPRSGSVTNSAIASGQLWWLSTLPPQINLEATLEVWITTGTTLNWTAGSACPDDVLIYYGVI